MCKAKLYKSGPNPRIDKCMRGFMMRLKVHLREGHKIVACCCGHNKYPMSIVIEDEYKNHYDLVSGELINRTRKFYKRDKEGYYYIPEVVSPL